MTTPRHRTPLRPHVHPLLRQRFHQQAPTAARRRGLLPAWGLLLLAVLLAQSLGQWHRVQHAPGRLPAAAGAAQVRAQAVEHAAPSRPHADGWGHSDGDGAQCQLYDHLASADSSWPVWAGLGAVPEAAGPVPRLADPVRPSCRSLPWQARAPPAIWRA